MSRYSFTSLSSQDFEELTRDLLQAEWKVRLEVFKSGRDQGIDLRYTHTGDKTTIVQCKHYAGSGFAKLLSHLEKVEFPKIEALQPQRYVLVTSLGLTPANKDEIIKVLTPYVISTSDIVGGTEVENLLGLHPEVERANFKLWFTSAAVHERVLHNAERCQTDFAVDRIRRKLPLFVQNAAYPRAEHLLDELRIVVISGVPGIGKTTLAEMLLYSHLERDFEPVVIQGDITEGKRLFKPSTKQIFYFDDFLGQTFLGDRAEYLGKNQDMAIVDFMEMVGRSPNSRFILTTREHIFRSALQISERLRHSPVLSYRCVLELPDYSLRAKARILYNHLYFSDLSVDYKEAVLDNAFYLTIIKHPHFNPRLIEWMSSNARLKGVSPPEYRNHVTDLLDSPEQIWEHAYRKQISLAARHAVLTIYTMGSCGFDQFESAFRSLHSHISQEYMQPILTDDFRSALQELEGSFLNYNAGTAAFLNPSVRDFIGTVIERDGELAADLVEAATFFKQVAAISQLARDRDRSALSTHLRADFRLLLTHFSRLLATKASTWEKDHFGISRWRQLDHDLTSKIRTILDAADLLQSPELAALAFTNVTRLIEDWGSSDPDYVDAVNIVSDIKDLTWLMAHGGEESARQIIGCILANLAPARAWEWQSLVRLSEEAPGWTNNDEELLTAGLNKYCDEGIDKEQRDYDDVEELTQFSESLVALNEARGLDLHAVIKGIDEEIAERTPPEPDDDDRPRYTGSGNSGTDDTTDSDISEMFATLRGVTN